ncbi:hypothetical protein [Dermatophilus congolensis]|uniref:hypothetical protein n=8 Tax=Dermatophilus congolensis TaxID=1863 RepID=UPI001AB034E7|nr:hypothetical protein [Dermatophilus congolensis]MBO3143992.1 hypothetical protein [Dermatophilus congolensis]MBO3216406.1 hypothetical protein [Dermatophilus congolensis]
MQESDEVTRLGESDTSNRRGGRRKALAIGASAIAVVVTGGLVAAAFADRTETPRSMPRASSTPHYVALSSYGHPLSITDSKVKQTLKDAQGALAGNITAPQNANNSGPIPPRALAAYRRAEAAANTEFPRCHAAWWMLAGIGKIASDHGAGTTYDAAGTTVAQIRGVRLDGRSIGTALVLDTDSGKLDGDGNYDRPMGPLQFLPGSWYLDAHDGNADGTANPDNIDDAAFTAAAAICRGGDDLNNAEGLARGLYHYTNDPATVGAILSWGNHYKNTLHPDPATSVPSTNTRAPNVSTSPRPSDNDNTSSGKETNKPKGKRPDIIAPNEPPVPGRPTRRPTPPRPEGSRPKPPSSPQTPRPPRDRTPDDRWTPPPPRDNVPPPPPPPPAEDDPPYNPPEASPPRSKTPVAPANSQSPGNLSGQI